MSKCIYTIEHAPTYGEIKVEIDFNKIIDRKNFGPITVEGAMKEMLLFWYDGQKRLDENEGSTLNAFLKMLCQKCLAIANDHNYNQSGVIKAFDSLEGWYPIDGSSGIKLLSISLMDLEDHEDYEIKLCS